MNEEDSETHKSHEFYSAFSNAAYYDTTDEKLSHLKKHGLNKNDEWEIDEEVAPQGTNNDRTIFRRKKKDSDGYDVIFTNRGTSQTRNLLPDLGIMFGGEEHTSRYRKLKTDFQKTKDKYSNADDTIVSSGHSLGGNQSVFLNRKFGVESHAFNPGASLSHMKQGFVSRLACWANPNWSSCKQADKSHIYHTPGDPLSTASLFGRDHKHIFRSKKDQYNPHAMTAFHHKDYKKSQE